MPSHLSLIYEYLVGCFAPGFSFCLVQFFPDVRLEFLGSFFRFLDDLLRGVNDRSFNGWGAPPLGPALVVVRTNSKWR